MATPREEFVLMGPALISRGKCSWRDAVICFVLVAAVISCGRTAGVATGRNDLSAMDTGRISIGDHSFEVWLATEPLERQQGLMHVTEDELASIPGDPAQGAADTFRGMLFIFAADQPLSFWMLNTIIPLDIAYIRADGEIVSTYTMAPQETRSYPSIEPARFALEVRAGLFAELGITPGDHVEIPESMLKGTP